MKKSTGEKKSADYNWLLRFGAYGDLIAIDIKLILRNKRPRMIMLLSVIFLFYGYIFFKPKNFKANNLGILIFASIFINIIDHDRFPAQFALRVFELETDTDTNCRVAF